MKELKADLFIVVAFRMLPKIIWEIPTKGTINLHASLLPKYRGCHTNFLQLSKGEKFSGVTLHKIDEGIDTGDIIDKIKFKIKINDTAQENYLRLMKFSTILFKKYFYKILNNNYKLKKQILTNGSYYNRRSVNY